MYKWLALAALVAYSVAIPIDNGVEGDPEIECGPTSITVNFNTQNAFQGHVYVKGQFDTAGCRNDEGGRQVAGISLPFDTCGTVRTRSLNPKGVFVSNTVVISFHPKFETKVDRAYRIQCFYMEADKTVSQELEVSMLTTGFQTQVVPMPVCRYEILSGGPTGTPVHFALVGDSVYHKWTCDTETVDTFCMVVHSCFVDDGNGDKVDLLTAEGCAVDKFLLNNLEYPTDLMAGQEAHVFKYADRTQLFFQCQITITIKEPAGTCPRPQCAVPEGFATGGTIAAGGATGASAGGSAPAAASNDKAPASASAAQPAPAPAPAAAAETSAAPAAAAETSPATTAAPAPAPAAAAEAKPAEGGAEAAPAQLRVLRKRQAPAWERENAGVMDVAALVKTLDIDDRLDGVPSELNQSSRQIIGGYGEPVRVPRVQDGFCLSTAAFTVLLALAALLFAAVVVVASCFLRSNRKF